MTVDALTTKMLDCQSLQTAHSQAHSNRSAGVSFGRLTERCRTPSCWRSARISSCNAARLRKEAKTAAQRANNRCLKGNRRGNGNSQFINQIGICENHRPAVCCRAASRRATLESSDLRNEMTGMQLIRFLVAATLLGLPAMAQTASLKGQVTDESGAVVPGATVTLNGPSGFSKAAVSGNDGSYSFAGLPLGAFTIRASAPRLALRQ